MRRVRILEEAAVEAIEAAAWYESRRVGLGADFADALNDALDLLEEEVIPLTALPGGRRYPVKRLMLRRFPYDIILTLFHDEILVVAVAHQSRRPGYWRKRLRS